jgi:hypothetical protein
VSTDATSDETDDGQTTAEAESEADADARRRRTIIRLLVGIGIGIPILVELRTFVGLIERFLFGGGDDTDGGASTGTARTDTERGVGVGDELLSETPQRETLANASFRAGSDSWVLTLVAQVENTESTPYTVQFGAVTTEDGRRVEGSGRSVTVAADETAQVTGTWQLSPGSRPATVEVTTGEGEMGATTHDVALAPIPVEGN